MPKKNNLKKKKGKPTKVLGKLRMCDTAAL